MKVLVIEDEPDVRELSRTTLMLDGFQTLVAPDAEEGMRLAVEEQPDVIVLDIMLPGKDGITMLDELKARPDTWRIPVILLTALVRPEIELEGMRAGADSYMRKPFSPADLCDEVRALAEIGPSVRQARRDRAIARLEALHGLSDRAG